jgi:hypothetical protein
VILSDSIVGNVSPDDTAWITVVAPTWEESLEGEVIATDSFVGLVPSENGAPVSIVVIASDSFVGPIVSCDKVDVGKRGCGAKSIVTGSSVDKICAADSPVPVKGVVEGNGSNSIARSSFISMKPASRSMKPTFIADITRSVKVSKSSGLLHSLTRVVSVTSKLNKSSSSVVYISPFEKDGALSVALLPCFLFIMFFFLRFLFFFGPPLLIPLLEAAGGSLIFFFLFPLFCRFGMDIASIA